jgi:hypothetical protein
VVGVGILGAVFSTIEELNVEDESSTSVALRESFTR